MAERLKVFKSENGVTELNHNLLTTTSTTQAVIKDINIVLDDSIYTRNVKITDGTTTFVSAKDALKATGTQIVDVNTSVDVVIEQEGLIKRTMLPRNFLVFGIDNACFTIDGLATNTSYSFDEIYSNTKELSSPISSYTASKTVPVNIGGIWYYVGYTATNGIFQRFTLAGGFMESYATQANYANLTSDGTYIYISAQGNQNTITRFNPSDSTTTTINLSTTVDIGQIDSGVFEYHNGYIYNLHYYYSYKIEVATGICTPINDANLGEYTGSRISQYIIGSSVIKNAQGDYLLVFASHNTSYEQVYVWNLTTGSKYKNNLGIGGSTTKIKANAIFELATGIIAVAYNNAWEFFDLNTTDTITSIQHDNNINVNYPKIGHYTATEKAFAYLPLHLIEDTYTAIPVTNGYSVYADGIEITGVN